MSQPGTPAIALPPYVAPAFSAASVPMGTVIASLTMEGGAAGDPFTIGHAFKQGALARMDCVVGQTAGGTLTLQMDVKATHPDGSVRHAIISGRAPSSPAPIKVDLVRAPHRAAAALVPQAVDIAALVTIAGVSYTASPSGTPLPWLSGPIATEYIYNVPLVSEGVPHPYLTAQFAVRSYDGNAKIDVVIEHTKPYLTQGFIQPSGTPAPAPIPAQMDIAYDVKILMGGDTRFEQAGLVHFPCSRWKKTFWSKGAPALFVRHDLRYLIDTMAVSSYPETKIDEAFIAGMEVARKGASFAPMGNGRFMAAMATTGGRPEIGMMPAEYAAYLLSGDRRNYEYVLAQADMAGSFPMHRRDNSAGPGAGRPMDIIHWPMATILGNVGDANNRQTGMNEQLPRQSSSTTLRPEESHQPAAAYLPYLLTGDFFYLEELHFWNNFNLILPNCAYRNYHQGVMSYGQVRGQAWNIRTMAQCAAITPDDHPYKSAANYFLDNTAAAYLVSHVSAPVPGDVTGIGRHHTAFGASGDGAVYTEKDWDVAGARIADDGSAGVAPWQDDFLMAALKHAYDLTGKADLLKIMQWKAKFVVGRMNCRLHNGVDSAVYSLRVREGKGMPFYATVDECYLNTFLPERYATPVDSPERLAYLIKLQGAQTTALKQGEIIGHSSSPLGYPSNMQPALAAAVEIGAPGALEAWTRFAARPSKPNYGAAPQFNIEPRNMAPAVQVPLPTPAPVPVPTPAPTPAPPAVIVPTKPVPPLVIPKPVGIPSVSISSERLIAGVEYVAYVTTTSGQILAVQIVSAK